MTEKTRKSDPEPIIFELEDEKTGEGVEHELPSKYEVCSRCEGKGQHSNPSIDGNGITQSEWAEWGDDEKESYLSGKYDVVCEECKGKRVVPVVDESQCDPKLLEAYRKHQQEQARADAEDRAISRVERMSEYGLDGSW